MSIKYVRFNPTVPANEQKNIALLGTLKKLKMQQVERTAQIIFINKSIKHLPKNF